MATFVPVPNTVEAHLRASLNGVPVENTLYFHKAEAWTVESMESFAATLALWWRVSIVSKLSSQYVYRETYLADLTSNIGLSVTDTSGASTPGSSGSDVGGNQLAFCLKFLTGRRGRSYRGRNYIPAIPEDQQGGSRILAGLANDFVTAYEILNSYDGLFGAQWCVVSRVADGAPRAFGISTPVVSVGYSTLGMRTQRGRVPE